MDMQIFENTAGLVWVWYQLVVASQVAIGYLYNSAFAMGPPSPAHSPEPRFWIPVWAVHALFSLSLWS